MEDHAASQRVSCQYMMETFSDHMCLFSWDTCKLDRMLVFLLCSSWVFLSYSLVILRKWCTHRSSASFRYHLAQRVWRLLQGLTLGCFWNWDHQKWLWHREITNHTGFCLELGCQWWRISLWWFQVGFSFGPQALVIGHFRDEHSRMPSWNPCIRSGWSSNLCYPCLQHQASSLSQQCFWCVVGCTAWHKEWYRCQPFLPHIFWRTFRCLGKIGCCNQGTSKPDSTSNCTVFHSYSKQYFWQSMVWSLEIQRWTNLVSNFDQMEKATSISQYLQKAWHHPSSMSQHWS